MTCKTNKHKRAHHATHRDSPLLLGLHFGRLPHVRVASGTSGSGTSTCGTRVASVSTAAACRATRSSPPRNVSSSSTPSWSGPRPTAGAAWTRRPSSPTGGPFSRCTHATSGQPWSGAGSRTGPSGLAGSSRSTGPLGRLPAPRAPPPPYRRVRLVCGRAFCCIIYIGWAPRWYVSDFNSLLHFPRAHALVPALWLERLPRRARHALLCLPWDSLPLAFYPWRHRRSRAGSFFLIYIINFLTAAGCSCPA